MRPQHQQQASRQQLAMPPQMRHSNPAAISTPLMLRLLRKQSPQHQQLLRLRTAVQMLPQPPSCTQQRSRSSHSSRRSRHGCSRKRSWNRSARRTTQCSCAWASSWSRDNQVWRQLSPCPTHEMPLGCSLCRLINKCVGQWCSKRHSAKVGCFWRPNDANVQTLLCHGAAKQSSILCSS